MGLFDFAADIGKSVFGIDDAEAAEKIKQEIEANNPGINLHGVDLHQGSVCEIRGVCDSAEAKEKVILMAGNMKGVSSVHASGILVKEAESAGTMDDIGEQADADFESTTSSEFYTIESGDTLWGIAAKFLGNGAKYPDIFEANREVIEDPDKIFVGQKIRIPK